MTAALKPALTDAQRRAAETLDRHLAVTAGPGSGKTRVLVNRYLNIIENTFVDLERIVAITFTKKAASEMRERVRKAFDERIGDTRGIAEHVWRDRKRRLEGAVITTIHGFCTRLLRENPVEAVVDPQFAILDEYSRSVMLDAAAEAAVTGLIESGEGPAARLVAAYGRAELVRELIGIFGRFRGLGVTIPEAEAATLASAQTGEDYGRLLGELHRLVDLLEPDGLPAASRLRVQEFLEEWERCAPALAGVPSQDRAVAFKDAVERLRKAGPSSRARALNEIVPSLRQLLGHKDAGSGQLVRTFFDVCGRDYAPLVFQALRTLDLLYAQEKRAAAALDQDDLQLRARELLRSHPEVVRRVRSRYRYFLVDEYQDTNGLQRDIIRLLALGEPRANLFIVGDRKQSIYGFRGAEVEVFAESIRELEAEGGEAIPLDVNFRSRSRVVDTVNAIFERLMQLEPGDDPAELERLGFVGHEPIEAAAPDMDDGPVVEILLDLPMEDGEEHRDTNEESTRDREARRLAERIDALVRGGEPVLRDRSEGADPGALRPARFRDVAVLLRAITDVKAYERAFRRRGIPFYVVAGKGFYDRPEVVDLLNLLEFLDNRTDELALAAVLRSPLFGVSDETLLALRADRLRRMAEEASPRGAARQLYDALRDHASTSLISPEQHEALDRAVDVLAALLALRNRVSISELLAEALRRSEYETVAASAEDGAQRLSNVDKLVGLARGFERGESRLLRDFVEFVREFRRLDAREAEALLRSDQDAVAVLTAHKSKGLEFPVVVMPDLQREFQRVSGNAIYDRLRGLAFKVPDGRGGLERTALYEDVAARRRLRERFESMRLLYVGMTRAQDLLILSGATDKKKTGLADKVLRECGCWLDWVLAILGVESASGETIVRVNGGAVRVVGPDADLAPPARSSPDLPATAAEPPPPPDPFAVVERVRRLLGPVAAGDEPSLRRFGASELQSYANCPRQFYYARLLRIPAGDGRPRTSAEAPAGGALLPPTLRGVVLHRFCETLQPGEAVEARLDTCLREVLAARGDEYPELVGLAGDERVTAELAPYARNYAESRMRRRVDERLDAGARLPDGRHELVRSEVPFTLRTRRGIVTGAIDKVLLTPLQGGRLRAFLVDFKTGYIGSGKRVPATVEREALEHVLQVQIYAHALWTLMPGVHAVEAALHFLQPAPNVEYHVPAELLTERRAAEAIERVLAGIQDGGLDPSRFEARVGRRCATCRFARFCPEARGGST